MRKISSELRLALRDTFTGVGVGRKTGSEAGEAIRRGHLFSSNSLIGYQSWGLHLESSGVWWR